MRDQTRFFMSIFLFAVLALNPLGTLLSAAGDRGALGSDFGDDAHAGGGRSLLFKFTDDAPGRWSHCLVSCPYMRVHCGQFEAIQ